jgi:hypothetical protein
MRRWPHPKPHFAAGQNPILVRSRLRHWNLHDGACPIISVRQHNSCGRSRFKGARNNSGRGSRSCNSESSCRSEKPRPSPSVCRRDSHGELTPLHSGPTPLHQETSASARQFLIVEYERSNPSPWGPYPVGFEKLRELFNESGVQRVEKLSTQRSRFGGTIYSAFAQLA